jgi:tripartite-type tricarboxylate transporter receptor subunit TctC
MSCLRFAPMLAITAFCLSATHVLAQAWPQRPVRLVVPVAAGGGSDQMARLMAEKMTPLIGQPMIVENKAGANSVIAAQYILSQPTDGHTVILSNSVMALRTALPNSPYDMRKDFDAVIQVGSGTYILYVNPKLPVNNVKELIAYARANPGKMNFSSIGVGTAVHLCIELLAQKGGFTMTHVPYSGSATSIPAVIAGDAHASVDALALIKPHADAGRLRVLGVTSAKRWALAPEWPGMEESGVPGYDVNFWIGVAVKKGTPPGITQKLSADFGRVLQEQAVKDFIRKLGTNVTGASAEELTRITEREVQVWGDVVKSANIKLE